MNPQQKQYDLLEIIELMKLHRVLKVELGSLKVELSTTAFEKEIIEEPQQKIETQPPLTQEDMLKIASPFTWK